MQSLFRRESYLKTATDKNIKRGNPSEFLRFTKLFDLYIIANVFDFVKKVTGGISI